VLRIPRLDREPGFRVFLEVFIQRLPIFTTTFDLCTVLRHPPQVFIVRCSDRILPCCLAVEPTTQGDLVWWQLLPSDETLDSLESLQRLATHTTSGLANQVIDLIRGG